MAWGPERLRWRAHRRHVVQLVRHHFRCGGFNAKDFFCVKDLDDQFETCLTSSDRTERKLLAEQIQRMV